MFSGEVPADAGIDEALAEKMKWGVEKHMWRTE